MRKLLFVIWMVFGAILVMAQDVRKELKADANRSAGMTRLLQQERNPFISTTMVVLLLSILGNQTNTGDQ